MKTCLRLRLRRLTAAAALFSALSLLAASAAAADWPQLQCDPQRTGWTPDSPLPPFKFVWEFRVQPDKIAHHHQVIVMGELCFFGTKRGAVYAVDKESGEPRWRAQLGGAQLDTLAASDGRVFAGNMDGNVYCLAAADGAELWKRQAGAGISASPLLVQGRLYIGNREGMVFRLDQASGTVLWQRQLPAPVMSSAAWGEGAVFVGAENMKLYRLAAEDGAVAWESEQLYGESFAPYHPVFHKGRVLAKTKFDAQIWAATATPKPDGSPVWVSSASLAEGGGVAPDYEAQQRMMGAYRRDPAIQSFFILDAATGRSAAIPYHAPWVGTLGSGAVAPAAVAADGRVVTTIIGATSSKNKAPYPTHRFALMDIETGLANWFFEPDLAGNCDETMNYSCGGRYAYFAYHWEFGNCHHCAVIDTETGESWIDAFKRDGRDAARRFADPEYAKLFKRWPPNDYWPYWHAVEKAGNAFTISGGMVYHIRMHQVGAWRSEKN